MEKYNDRIKMILSKYDVSERDKMLDKIIEDVVVLKEKDYNMAEYMELGLYRFPKEQWLDEYLFDKDTYEISKIYNSRDVIKYSDKWTAYQRFKEYYRREIICVTSIGQADQLIKFAEKHKKIVLKPRYGSLGVDVELYTWRKISTLKDVEQLLVKYDHNIIAEQCIDQHKDLAKYNNRCVNTLRVTFIGDKIYYTFRNGITNHIADSINKGGLVCGIDQNGKILRAFNGCRQEFYRNPYSKIVLKDNIIPDVQGVTMLLSNLMMQLPNINYIGWDMAKSNDGWCIVELNTKPTVVGIEMGLDKGLKKEIILK